VDLGCGSGELTRLLAERWPDASIVGLDSSAAMLRRARRHRAGKLEFKLGDIGTWRSEGLVDLIFSNAALQWVADHQRLMPALGQSLAPGGVLAVQMPNHCATAAHQAITRVVMSPTWRPMLQGVGLRPTAVRPLGWYTKCFLKLGFQVEAWETTYVHLLQGDNPVLEWMTGTALRPLLSRLPKARVKTFLHEVGGELQAAYPAHDNVTLFPFPWVFFVAAKPERTVPCCNR
jgi:trans-aconitate 2-methyltransferase